jgi:hypothetical protein
VRTFGQTTPLNERSWEELVRDWSARLDGAPIGHMVAIIESVIESGCTSHLVAASSMYDLIVAERPIPEPPCTVVIVRSPVSVKPPAQGMVVIEHTSLTGRTDRIERPVAEAVPLFWRFMAEKLGVSATLR